MADGLRGQCWDLVAHDLHAHREFGDIKPDLVQKPSVESRVEVIGKVGGGDQDAIEILHLLQDDVLHGVKGLRHGFIHPCGAPAEDAVGFVEQQDRFGFSR